MNGNLLQAPKVVGSRINRRGFLSGMGAAAAGLALTACGTGNSGGKGSSKSIGFAWASITTQIYIPLIKGARAAAAERGYTVLEDNNGGQSTTQITDIDTWIAQSVSGITMLPLDPQAIAPVIQKAEQAGIPVVGYASKLPGEDGVILFDDVNGSAALGKAASQWINANLGGKAQVVFLGDATLEVQRNRIAGIKRALQAGSPGANAVANETALTAADGLTVMNSLLQAHPGVDVVLCGSDDACTGVESAMKTAGKDPEKVFIGGMDGAKAALQGVLNGGMIKAVAALNCIDIGKAVINMPADIIEHKQPVSYTAKEYLVDRSSLALGHSLLTSQYGS